MQRPLPSLKALRAFETAARHLSFKKAGQELHVTPAAISQQIKALEEEFGEALFLRQNRTLVLTHAGRLILPELREGFGGIARAVQRLYDLQSRCVLKVASAPAFAAKWLVPNLESFSGLHPGYDVYVVAAHELIDYDLEHIDIGIRYGYGDYPGLLSEKLLPEALFPVCSPRLIETRSALRTPDDLRGHTLLHDDSLGFDDTFPDWAAWLAAVGANDVEAIAGPRFNTASDAIEAAIQGAGILLARQSVASADISAGKLVRLFEFDFPLKQSFHVVYSEANIRRPEIQAFRNWLVKEMTNIPDGTPRA